ncbi:MAG: hypothetical protein QM662_03560 [Gordonia sp. (in: high G+C Gram-positive bacteria)]
MKHPRSRSRWLGPDWHRTRTRYELTIAALHNRELTAAHATTLVAAIHGLVLVAMLRGTTPEEVNPPALIDRFHT